MGYNLEQGESNPRLWDQNPMIYHLSMLRARIARIELTLSVMETNILPLNYIPGIVRIELTPTVLKTAILPLDYIPPGTLGFEPKTYRLTAGRSTAEL